MLTLYFFLKMYMHGCKVKYWGLRIMKNSQVLLKMATLKMWTTLKELQGVRIITDKMSKPL